MEKYLTADEVAKLLTIEKVSVYGMVARGQIPCLKITGRLLRFKESEIQAWLDSKSRDARYRIKPGFKQPVKSKKTLATSVTNVDRIVEIAKREVLG